MSQTSAQKGYLSILGPNDAVFITAVKGRLPRAQTIVGRPASFGITTGNVLTNAVHKAVTADTQKPGLFKATLRQSGPLTAKLEVAKRPLDLAKEIAWLEDLARSATKQVRAKMEPKVAARIRTDGILCRAMADALRQRMAAPVYSGRSAVDSVENFGGDTKPSLANLRAYQNLRFWGLDRTHGAENPRVGFSDYELALEWLRNKTTQNPDGVPQLLDRQEGVTITLTPAKVQGQTGRYIP